MVPNKVKDEPQSSKHKSTFKPAKIVSRKDLKKQNIKVDMTDIKNVDSKGGDSQIVDNKVANK